MDQKQEELFWETLKIFNEICLSAHVMLIGSWAEYFYKDMFKTDFRPEIRTRDIDFMYRNISIPDEKIPLIAALTQNGYLYTEDPYSGVAKFYKEDLLELEFLTRVQGSGRESVSNSQFGYKVGGAPGDKYSGRFCIRIQKKWATNHTARAGSICYSEDSDESDASPSE